MQPATLNNLIFDLCVFCDRWAHCVDFDVIDFLELWRKSMPFPEIGARTHCTTYGTKGGSFFVKE